MATRLRVSMAVAALLAIAACGGDTGGSSGSASSSSGSSTTGAVTITNFHFQPDSATSASGKPVTWTNNDSAAHTVTADDKSFDSGKLEMGKSYSFTVAKPGTYKYHCSIHTYMTGTITVQ